jgi:hypothetical protein
MSMETSSNTKSEVMNKMNRRHGTDISDYFMMLAWLRKTAERLERKGTLYADQATEYRADYNELLAAAE